MIILVSGGTGGHLFPALATQKALKNRGFECQILTDERGIKHLEESNATELTLGIKHKTLFHKFWGLFKDYKSCKKLFKACSPNLVIGFGGYPSLAPLLAAASLNIPIIIHEQNALLGKANRILAPFAKTIALSFEHTDGIKPKYNAKCKMVGNPVRSEILEQQTVLLQPNDTHFNLLVTGGSQGAKLFSEIMPLALKLLPEPLQSKIRLTQQVRSEYLRETRQAFEGCKADITLYPFIKDIGTYIIQSDLMICRAGASTIAENLVLGAAGLYIPLPSASENHQTLNAKALKQMGAGKCMSQDELTPKTLALEIKTFMENPSLAKKMKQMAKAHSMPKAAEKLCDIAIRTIG